MAGPYTLCQVLINTGSGPNDGSGDSIRDAFIKVNEGFQTLWGGGPSGPQGPQGVQGPSGVQGYQGSQGVQGIIGHQGPTGVQGLGAQGFQGFQGCIGPQGYQGSAGAQGIPGCGGNHGSQGAQGYQGYQGNQGLAGGRGYQGIAGPVAGCSGNIIYNNSGSAGGFGCWNGSRMKVTGDFVASGNVTAYCTSDIKFKENISDITNALSAVNAIGGKTYDWTENYIASHGGADGYYIQKTDFGVIAQDVQAAFPLAVRTKSDGTLAVDYQKLVALAFAAIRELTERVNQLESKKEE